MRPHRLIDGNPVVRAIRRAARLSRHDVDRQTKIVNDALQAMLKGGADAGARWLDLADTANLAETLAAMRIGFGPDADEVIADAQTALAWMQQERRDRGTWALRADERQELEARFSALRDLHRTQLALCSYGEFEQAYRRTEERVRQARAGNAPRDAIVIEGLVG